MKPFNQSKVFEILKERWRGKDMEAYFKDKGERFAEKLKKDLGK